MNHMKIQNSVIFVKKNFKINIWNIKKYPNVRDHCRYIEESRGAAHSICNLKYSEPKKNFIIFHNGCKHDYHFIIKELAEKSKKKILI